MANYQLTVGNQTICPITVTDQNGNEIPGLAPDAGSVTVSASDGTLLNVTTDGSTTVTIASGTATGTDDTVTVDATVGGTSLSGTLVVDVVAVVVTPVPTSLVLTPGPQTPVGG